MNKAYFKIRNYIIPIIPEIQYNDLMDGTPDNMSFSFPSEENLSEIINIKEKCEIEIYNSEYPLVGNVDFKNNILVINGIEYTISNSEYIVLNDEVVGSIYDNKINILDVEYLYFDDLIYLDNRIHYYMCVAQISSEKMSTAENTGYMTTVLLNEQTILLKDCIRTDIAISPSLYPVIPITDEEGNKTYKNVFDTLLDATMKIIDCHNMCTLNDFIKDIDADLSNSLRDVACPNLTYRDLSTYSQLYDVFMRIGRVPYYENGILYGIKLQGKRSTKYDISEFSTLSSLKETGKNDNIYSSKTYNNLYDKESAIVPQIFEDILYDMPYFATNIYNSEFENLSDIYYRYNFTAFDQTLPQNITYMFRLDDNTFGITTNAISGMPIQILQLSYDLLQQSWEISFISNVDDNIISKGDIEYVSYTYNDNKYLIKLTKSNETIFSAYDNHASTSTTRIPFKNGSPDEDAIQQWLATEYRKWSQLDYQSENDISKTLLFVRGYDYNSKNIEDARNYSLELPFNIELVEEIYSCSPIIAIQNELEYSAVSFGWCLQKYDNNRILENGLYENLSALQKRTCAYYVRGSNIISNVVCLNIVKESDDSSIWDIFKPISTAEDYQGAYAWSMTKVYNDLRKNFFVVKYKPILDTMYTNYDYYNGEENKPLSIQNFNLPYSQVTDKQVYPILDYNLEKGLDTTYDIKFITEDINILNIEAGDIIKYNGLDHIVNKISTYINNISFECTLSITDNIVQNSIISSYADNVRVSSLLSAESCVNRYVHLFGENVIRLMDYNEEGATERHSDFNYFTQEIGNNMSMKALNRLSLSVDTENTYTYISKYPFRFDTILQYEQDNDEPIEYYIKLSTGTSIDNEDYITLTDDDFPVTLYQMHYDYVTSGGNSPLRYGLKTVSNTPAELSANIYLYGYYTSTFLGLPIVDHYLRWYKTDTEWVDLFPSSEFVDHIADGEEPLTGNYRFYYSNKEYDTTNYGTEKMISTSGKITKVEYSFPTSSYVTNTFLSTGLPSIEINYSSNAPQQQKFSDMKILSSTPVLFNTTTNGCKLAGFGNKENDFYSLYSLPHVYDKAYYLDLREIPRPYIQYKTLFRGSNVIEAKQLSSEIDFMTAGRETLGTVSCQFYVLEIPKFLNLDNFNINDNWRKYIVSEINSYTLMDLNNSATLTLSKPISRSENSDYLLLRVVPEDILYGEEIYKILKFNIKDGHTVDKLCLRSELYSEI